MKGGLQPHLVRDDWLGLDLLHPDWLVEERALMQGELLVRVERRADLEGGRGRGTNAGQHLRLAECLRQRVAGGVSCVALQVSQGEGPGAQVGRRRLHAVQGVGWHHMWRRLARLGTFCLHGIIICLDGAGGEGDSRFRFILLIWLPTHTHTQISYFVVTQFTRNCATTWYA